jgi:hypothetical protein
MAGTKVAGGRPGGGMGTMACLVVTLVQQRFFATATFFTATALCTTGALACLIYCGFALSGFSA